MISYKLLDRDTEITRKQQTNIELVLGISLPEAPHGEEARSWFRQFKVCVAANEWDEAKKFRRVLTLLKGQAWAVYEALTDEETDTYDHLKTAILEELSPDMDEERLRAKHVDDLEKAQKVSMIRIP